MKQYAYIVTLLLLPSLLHGQHPADTSISQRIVYQIFDVEKQPQFPGGDKEFYIYLTNNFNYPAVRKTDTCALQSDFAFSFIIEASGTITNILEKRPVCNKQVKQYYLAVLQKMPRWKPGEKEGKPVAVQYFLPIKIHLE